MKCYVGVDGGGTKTELIVCDEKGNILARELGTSSNPNDIGKEKMVSVIGELIKKSLPSTCDCADIGLGISGISTDGGEEYLREYIKQNPVFDKISVCSDKDSCLNSAYDKDGAIVIMGTGNVAFVRKDNAVKQIAGGGYFLGDALSGFDLGREVLNAVFEAEDGRGEQTLLTALFEQEVGENIRQHLKIVYKKGKAYVATFAKLIFKALELGDRVAENALSRCVLEFEKTLNAVYRLMGEKQCEITIFGGLTKQFDVIKSFLSEDIKNKCVFKLPQNPIVYGVIKEFLLEEERAAFAENLIRSYAKL